MSDAEQDYVSRAAWVKSPGRADAIDEIADQFERPGAEQALAPWVDEPVVRWPTASRGWREAGRLGARVPTSRMPESRAG